MSRTHFERSLIELHVRVADMATLTEDQLRSAMIALKNRDAVLAQEVIKNDERVDLLENRIEHECVSLIALQQPIAKDLRLVTAVLKMITDIERVADQAADICELMISELPNLTITIPSTILEMGNYAASMVHDAVHAYLQQDEEQARGVIERDERMDDWFEQMTGYLCDLLKSGAEPRQVIKLAYVAKYLERVADHATNVAEWALYRLIGER